MQSLLNEISQKIITKENSSGHPQARKLKKIIVLNKRTVGNALSKNKKIGISEKLKILKSLEGIKRIDESIINEAQKSISANLNNTIQFKIPLNRGKRRIQKIVLKKMNMNKTPMKIKEKSLTAGMLANVQDLLFPHLNRNSLANTNS
jgi:hypothetical protein